MGHICGLMDAAQFLKTRVSAETKALVRATAQRQFITESIWFRRAIENALRAEAEEGTAVSMRPFQDRRSASDAKQGDGARLYVRLRPDDRMLLRERAAARGMAGATYASVYLRAHLRNLPPLPKEELLALKRAVAELGVIGRNLNQIARAANQGHRSAGPAKDDLRALLTVCEALRDHVKRVIKSNLNSWAVGHAETEG